MKFTLFHFFIILNLIININCTQKKILDKDELKNILKELHLIKALANQNIQNNGLNDTLANLHYLIINKKFNVSKEEIENSINYYNNTNIKIMQKIYENIKIELNDLNDKSKIK